MANSRLVDKIWALVNAALRIGVFGPTIKSGGGEVTNSNVLQVRANDGTSDAVLDVAETDLETLKVTAADAKVTTVTMQNGAAGPLALNLPNTIGNPGDSLKTDGAGNWYYETEDQEGVRKFDLLFNSASTTNLTNMPANTLVVRVLIDVTTPFTGGTGATLAVGIAGTTNKFVDVLDVALGIVGTFVIDVVVPQVAAAQMIATYTANGATAGAAKIYPITTIPN